MELREIAVGFDLSSRRGSESARFGGSFWTILLDALDHAETFDWSVQRPEMPAVIDETWDDPPTPDWPFDGELTPEELAFFGFRSPDPDRVAGLKLADNELWLIDEDESRLLSICARGIAVGTKPRVLGESAIRALSRTGQSPESATTEINRQLLTLAHFCHRSAGLGGFWAC